MKENLHMESKTMYENKNKSGNIRGIQLLKEV